MKLWPDTPEKLGPHARAFYDELRHMIDHVAPSKLDLDRSTVEFDDGGIDVYLAHRDADEWFIDVSMDETNAIVFTATAHEHFFPDDAPSTEPGRPWSSVIVDFVAEILRGEIEVHTTWRGSKPIAVQHFLVEPNGERGSLGTTGYLRLARFMIWREKRATVERISFQ